MKTDDCFNFNIHKTLILNYVDGIYQEIKQILHSQKSQR